MKAAAPKAQTDFSRLAFISLGSNLGTPANNIRHAMERLQDFSDKPILQSSLWHTSPVDCPPGSPEFVNAVVGFVPRAGETPESLLGKLQGLEKESGRRQKKVTNEPRLLDLDLISFGQELRQIPKLALPHPRAHERKFVLQPLSEIAPSLVLPGQKKTVTQLLESLITKEVLVHLKG